MSATIMYDIEVVDHGLTATPEELNNTIASYRRAHVTRMCPDPTGVLEYDAKKSPFVVVPIRCESETGPEGWWINLSTLRLCSFEIAANGAVQWIDAASEDIAPALRRILVRAIDAQMSDL